MSKLGLHGKLVARPGERDALVEVLLEAANVLADVAGMRAVRRQYYRDRGRRGLGVTELWTSEDAHDQSLTRDDVKAVVQRACR